MNNRRDGQHRSGKQPTERPEGSPAEEKHATPGQGALPRKGQAPGDAVLPGFGDYLVEEELGRGGMGVVYRARDERLGRQVAIKVLYEDAEHGKSRMEMLRREARVLASLNHPNIAAIYGMEESDDLQYMVLELVEGDTLRERLMDGALELEETLSVCTQIAQAMEAAHARQIVHRDLKPDNVKLAPDGRVKVLDFGLAKRFELAPGLSLELKTETRSTRRRPQSTQGDVHETENELLGTPAYMSPEQVRGSELDHRVDIWAFGCILFECLTGGVPFWGDDEYGIVLAALNEEPELSYLPPDTPQEIKELIAGCLVKKREDRISDMAQVRRTLRQVAERERSGAPQARIGNLPVEVTSFIGRETELERLRELLATTRILTLTGSGGCGKTRLSLHLARELQKDFRDGVWLIELAALTEPELVEQEIAACFQVKPSPGRTLHDAIVSQLQSRSTLLLFDNCEHLLDATAEIVDMLARSCPQLKIIVTSREALGVPGEVSFRVPSLKTLNPRNPSTLEEKLQVASIRLFLDRAITANPGFMIDDRNQETVAQICYRLDGIPLAIELAAARVRMLSVEQIAAKLDDRFRLLTGGSRTALPRQQTLRALIDWSYDHLTSEEQALLRSLSVFMGEWSFEAALWVHGEGEVDELETLDVLTRLVDKSLVLVEASAQQVRYRLLETIRQYARDRMLEAGDASELRRRHLEHYRRFAKEAAGHFGTQDEAIWLDSIEREHDNLREAMDWCFGDDVYLEHGIEIALSMQPFWLVRGYLREGFERLNVAAAKSEELEPTHRAQADSAMAGMALELGEIDKARQLYMRACVTFVELGDESEAAQAQANVGHACWRLGYLEEAEAHLLGALDVLKRLDRQPRISGILRSLGIIMYRRGDMAAASDYIAEATEIDRFLGNEQGLSGNLQLAALIHMRLGRFNLARKLHEEALAIMQRLNYRPGISMQLINLASLATEDGDFSRARELLEQSLALARELGRKVTIAEALGCLGEIAHRVGDCEEARSRYRECMEICEQMKDRQGQARAFLGTARIELELGNRVQAGVDFRRSIELFRECGSILELGMALQEASDYLEACGNSNGSLAFLGLALREWKQANVSLSPGLRESVETAVSARTQKLGAERAESLLRNAIGLPLETVLELLAPETEPSTP